MAAFTREEWEAIDWAWRNSGRAPQTIVAPPQWQPIETAPRDGRMVLLFDPGFPPQPVIGFWDTYEDRQYWSGPGGIGFCPTHWMPLPEPPK